MRMYHPTYGWMQDDHIYERIIGWRGPMPRWVGKLDWLFEKPGKRSAFGGWQGNMSMSLRSFFTEAWNHLLGGSWSGGESYLFSNYLQAVTVGWAYVEEHNGWRYVSGGKEGAMARLQQALAAPGAKEMEVSENLLGGLQTQNGPLYIDGMILNTDNPYWYSPVAYFNYTLKTGAFHLAIYSGNSVQIISIDGQGNLTDRTSKVGPKIDLMKYTSNKGFWQLPRNYAKSSLDEALGPKYSNLFWQVFINGDGYFLTDKPFKAIRAYLNDSPYSDITFRFRFNVNNFEGHNYNVVINVYYGK